MYESFYSKPHAARSLTFNCMVIFLWRPKRNIKVCCKLMHLLSVTNLETVSHKFLVSDHSYLPCDSDFGMSKSMQNLTLMYIYIALMSGMKLFEKHAVNTNFMLLQWKLITLCLLSVDSWDLFCQI